MPSISPHWTKTATGFERDDDSLAVGIYVTTADVHYHGEDVHVRPDVPKGAANAFQVYAVTDLGATDGERVSLINYADLSDAVTFATLVTRYLDERNSVVGIEEIAERDAAPADDRWLEGVVDGDDHPPRDALARMLGPDAGHLDDALST